MSTTDNIIEFPNSVNCEEFTVTFTNGNMLTFTHAEDGRVLDVAECTYMLTACLHRMMYRIEDSK